MAASKSRKRTAKSVAADGPSRQFELVHFHVCDDVRFEVSRKLTLVGVYNDEILVGTSAATFPQLVILFVLRRLGDELPKTARFSLETDDGTQATPTGEFALKNSPLRSANIAIHLTGLTLAPANYVAKLTVNGAHEFEGKFLIRIAEQGEMDEA